MTESNGRSFWSRLVLAILPLAVLGFVAVIALRSDVHHIEEELSTKANRETVEAQNRAILQTLEDIRADIRDLRRVVVKP